MARSLVAALRPRQWTKNLIVFAGLIFGERLLDPAAVTDAVAAFAIFCLLSGVVYVVNDVRDRDADRLHPVKSRRPIAAGDLPVGSALLFALVVAALALAFAFRLSIGFGALAATYLVLLTRDSLWVR